MRTKRILPLLGGLLIIATGLSLWSSTLRVTSEPYAGLTLAFYNNPDLTDPPLFLRRATDISLAFLDQEPGLPRQSFSLRWDGWWDARHDGPIDIYGGADDRVRIFVDDALLIDRSVSEGLRSVGRTVEIPSGLHRLRVDFIQLEGSSRLNVVWGPAGGDLVPFAASELFADEPRPTVVNAARRLPTVQRAARVAWFAFVLASLIVAVSLVIAQWPRIAPHRAQIAKVAAWGTVAVIAIRAIVARTPGWNPESLWADDLVWGAITRAQDWGTMLALPTHAPPGFFLLLRITRTVFSDPEWSLQILPFVAGILAIPVMALVAKRVTGSDGLAVLAAALTALNPLLAHYTVFVKQYSFDFLITALLLLAGLPLLTASAVNVRRYARFAVLSGVALFFSVTSVFTGFAIVNLTACLSWLFRRAERMRVIAWAAVYDGILLAAYFLLRARVNDSVREDFSEGFLPLRSLAAAGRFLGTEGRRLLETGFPSWGATEIWAPETVSWTLPFLIVGLAWVLVRPATRGIGLVVLGFCASCLAASAMRIYPIGPDRTDIFAFPVVMLVGLFAVHAVTAWSTSAGVLRAIVGVAAAAYALVYPIHVEYWGVNDSRMITRLVASAVERDAVILSPTGTFLAAHYGPWPIVISTTELRSNATDVEVVRPLTLHLPPGAPPKPLVSTFLAQTHPATVWYVGFRTGANADVVAALSEQGYTVTDIEETTLGHLYQATLSVP